MASINAHSPVATCSDARDRASLSFNGIRCHKPDAQGVSTRMARILHVGILRFRSLETIHPAPLL
jgi:hypothetical protein